MGLPTRHSDEAETNSYHNRIGVREERQRAESRQAFLTALAPSTQTTPAPGANKCPVAMNGNNTIRDGETQTFLNCGNSAILKNGLLIDAFLRLAPLHALVGRDARLVCVNVEEAHAAMIAAVATIAPESGSSSIAHPERRSVVCLLERAVFVGVITIVASQCVVSSVWK